MDTQVNLLLTGNELMNGDIVYVEGYKDAFKVSTKKSLLVMTLSSYAQK